MMRRPHRRHFRGRNIRMKIDKTLFIMLTSSLAGCVIHAGTGPDTPVATNAPPAPAANPAATPAVAPAPASASGKLIFGGRHRAALQRPAGDPAVAPAVPGLVPAAPATPATPGIPAPTDEGGACVNSATTAAAATCKKFATDANCAKAQQMCTAFNAYYKPVAASAGVTTISSSPADCANAAAEGHRAANSANLCADSKVTQACAALAVQCKTTPDACAKELAQLNDAGLQKVASCAAANSCGAGLHGCVNQLFPTFEWGPY